MADSWGGLTENHLRDHSHFIRKWGLEWIDHLSEVTVWWQSWDLSPGLSSSTIHIFHHLAPLFPSHLSRYHCRPPKSSVCILPHKAHFWCFSTAVWVVLGVGTVNSNSTSWRKSSSKRNTLRGTSLMVQWLRLELECWKQEFHPLSGN